MYRLCLPENIPDYGSSPLFSLRRENEKFWRRTGYELHQYRSNYDKLKKIKASDPHPKRDRKRSNPENVDSNDPMILAWMERHPGLIDEDYPEATAGYGGTRRRLFSQSNMKYLFTEYLASHPHPGAKL